MRAAPPVTVTLGRSRLAVAALAVLATAAIAVCAAWVRERDDAWGGVLLLVCLHAAWLASSVARREPLRLGWDGERWWLGVAADRGDPQPGTVAVALDLGHWLLLRFRPDAAPRTGGRWLPAERAALPADWHGLRCAVYSPRPAPAADAASST